MSKLFYEAMRTMPAEFICDKTRHCYNEDAVFVINPDLPPAKYTAAGGWETLELQSVFSPAIPPQSAAGQTP